VCDQRHPDARKRQFPKERIIHEAIYPTGQSTSPFRPTMLVAEPCGCAMAAKHPIVSDPETLADAVAAVR
jgi:hypothetical protein